jgi:hypothetical protein
VRARLVVIAILLCACPVHAQPSATLEIEVRFNAIPVADVMVVFNGTTYITHKDGVVSASVQADAEEIEEKQLTGKVKSEGARASRRTSPVRSGSKTIRTGRSLRRMCCSVDSSNGGSVAFGCSATRKTSPAFDRRTGIR